MNLSNLIAKFFLYFLPFNLLVLMIFTQASYHFLKYQKDKNEYSPKGNLLELNSIELKKFYIYLDPIGHYFFDNHFIDLLLSRDYGEFISQDNMQSGGLSKRYAEFNAFLQNIRFVRQDMLIHAGSTQLSAVTQSSERLLGSPIQIGINEDDTPKLCYKPRSFQMLFESENIVIWDILSLASRFACDCNNYSIASFDISHLDRNKKIDFYNANRAFIRESLNVLKPVKVSAKLYFCDFINYVIANNFTMNSSEIEARTKQLDSLRTLCFVVTYFLLVLQAGIFWKYYERILK